VRHSRHRRPRISGRLDAHVRTIRPRAAHGSPGSRLRRALRVILVIGGSAAAVGTAVGMVAAVVALGEGEIRDPLSAVSSGVLPGIGSLTSHGAGSLSTGLAGNTIHKYHGKGGERPRIVSFSVSGAWQVRWSFRCRAGRQGSFVLTDTSGHAHGIHTSGNRGSGLWPRSGKPGYHKLAITSNCQWSAYVVLRAPVHATVSHSARPSHSPRHSPSRSPRPTPSSSPPPTPTPTPSPSPSASPSPTPNPRHSHSPRPRHTHTPPPTNTG